MSGEILAIALTVIGVASTVISVLLSRDAKKVEKVDEKVDTNHTILIQIQGQLDTLQSKQSTPKGRGFNL